MQVEVDMLIASMTDYTVRTIASTKYYKGVLSGKSVVVACCGIGKVNAAMTTSFLLANFDVKYVINLGVAGGLHPDLRVGDIVVSNKCVQYDYQADLLNSPTKHNLDRLGLTYLDSDETLTTTLAQAVRDVHGSVMIGTVATGDKFIADKAIANSIREEFSAAAIEMEAGAMAHVCMLYGIGFVSLRTISDSANDDAEYDFAQNMKITAQTSCKILLKWLQDFSTQRNIK